MRIAILLILLHTPFAIADSYLSVSKFKNTFEGPNAGASDREFISTTAEETVIKFSHRSDVWGELTGGVSIDNNNKIIDGILSFPFKGKLFRVESHDIKGQIVSDGSDYAEFDGKTEGNKKGFVYGDFTSSYYSLSLADYKPESTGHTRAYSFTQITLPMNVDILDEDGSPDESVLDPEAEVYLLGLGIFYDPLHNYMVSNEYGSNFDWYFSVRTIVGAGIIKLSNSEDLEKYDAQGKIEPILFGNQGSYELGVFYGFKSRYVSGLLHAGYKLSLSNGLNLLKMFDGIITTPQEGDVDVFGFQFATYGPGAGFSILF